MAIAILRDGLDAAGSRASAAASRNASAARRMRVPDTITLMPLPPYGPELNPVENIWQYLRQNEPSFAVWDGIDAIVDACCAA